MYLSLAAIVTGVVLSGFAALGQGLSHFSWNENGTVPGRRWSNALAGGLLAAVGVVLGILTIQRNSVYNNKVALWEDTVAQAPFNFKAHNNLGEALMSSGRHDEAVAEYKIALGMNPRFADAHNNLANALANDGRVDEAIPHYREALETKPDDANVHFNFGTVLSGQGLADEAMAEFQRALEIQPENAEFHYYAGNALASHGRFREAIAQYQETLGLSPADLKARLSLGVLYGLQGKVEESRDQWQEVMRSPPQDVSFLNKAAWILATHPVATVRNGEQAVAFAQRALQLSGGEEPAILDTLAAAYAEVGRFSAAVETAQRALALASARRDRALVDALDARIKLYQSGSPFRGTLSPVSPIGVGEK
jgi:tetratricopeptide (TPR) repeat protein